MLTAPCCPPIPPTIAAATATATQYGWSEAGWHRNYSIGGVDVPATTEVRTPALDALVREGIELDVVTLERVLAEFGLLQRWVAEMQQASPTPACSQLRRSSTPPP